MAIWAKNPYFRSPWGGSKSGENEFSGKSKNVMFLHSLRLSYMQKIRKFYRAVFRENIVRQRDRDGPEFKGPPDTIAKPSDQKEAYRVRVLRGLDKKFLHNKCFQCNTNYTYSTFDTCICLELKVI